MTLLSFILIDCFPWDLRARLGSRLIEDDGKGNSLSQFSSFRPSPLFIVLCDPIFATSIYMSASPK